MSDRAIKSDGASSPSSLAVYVVTLFAVGAIFSTSLDKLFAIPQLTLLDDSFILFCALIVGLHLPQLVRRADFFGTSRIRLALLEASALVFVIGATSLLRNLGLDAWRLALGSIFFLKPVILFIAGALIGQKLGLGCLTLLYRIQLLLAILFLSMGLLNAMFPEQWTQIFLEDRVGSELRLTSLFDNAGRTSFYCVVVISFGLAMLIFADNVRLATVSFLLVVGALILLRETLVRKSLLGFAAVALTAAIIIFCQTRDVRARAGLLAALGVTVPILLFFTMPVIERFADFGGDFLITDRSRVALFAGAFYLLSRDAGTLLFGTGFGTWGGIASGIAYSPLYFELGFDRLWGFSPDAPSYTGDNYAAHVLAEVGIVGTSLWLIVFGSMYIAAFRCFRIALRVPLPNSARVVAVGAFLTMIAGAFETIGISAPEISAMAIPFLFVPGLVLGAVAVVTKTD